LWNWKGPHIIQKNACGWRRTKAAEKAKQNGQNGEYAANFNSPHNWLLQAVVAVFLGAKQPEVFGGFLP
jgi:hypothetical protein